MPKNNDFGSDKHDTNNNQPSRYPNGTQWWDPENLGIQKRDNQTIYDGFGNFTHPFSTGQRYINRRGLSFHALFYTQDGGFDASYAVGRRDKPVNTKNQAGELTTPSREHQFSQSLIGFHTKNESDQDMPTMTIYLFGYRDWEQILRVNDYVALRVHERYPDSPSQMQWYGKDWDDPDEIRGLRERTLMCGLISNVDLTGSVKGGRVYTVTCQGMQKVLANVNLGLPKTAQWGAVNLLFDINGESNPANESFIFGSSNTGSSNGSSSGGGTSKETGNQVERGIIKWCNDHGFTKNETAGVLASAKIESQMGQANNGNNLLGISTNNSGDSQKKMSSYDYMNMFNRKSGRVMGWKDSHKSSSAYECGKSWGTDVEADTAHDDGERGSIAEKYAKDIS